MRVSRRPSLLLFLPWCALWLCCLFGWPDPAVAQIRSVDVAAHDIAYSPLTKLIYASAPTANAVVAIDPLTATTVGTPLLVGSQPDRLAMSDTGEYLYVGFEGASVVKRIHLVPSPAIDLEIPLGSHSFFGPMFVDDMEVMPGNPDVIAVSREVNGVSPRHEGVVIFDRGVQRPNVTDGTFSLINQLEFGSPQRLYGANTESTEFGFRRMTVDNSGVTIVDVTGNLIEGFSSDFEFDAGRVYDTNGRIVDPEARNVTGTFAEAFAAFRTAVEPHSAARVAFYVTQDAVMGPWTLRTFSLDSQLQVGVPLPLTGVTDDIFTPVTLIKWGPNGLALCTTIGGKVWLIDNGLTAPQEPSITITTPTADPTYETTPGTLTIGGAAQDPGGTPSQIMWSNDRGGAGAIAGATTWQIDGIALQPGVNTITVTLVGSTGRRATDTIVVTIVPPVLSYFLAEGATGSFFDTDLAIANPGSVAAPIAIRYLLEGGATVTQTMTLLPTSRTTIRVDEVAGLENASMSTIVQSTAGLPLVVERTMRWDDVGQYGSHTDKATSGVSPTWYFAEGSQGFFATFLLLANPNTVSNTATVDWLRENEAPVRRTYPLQPNSRKTIFAGDDPELVGRSFGIVVTFDTPAVADRTMYFGLPPDVLFKGGHNSAGVNAPSTDWLLAEGATGPFFETFILIANPNAGAVTATLTFLPDNGAAVERVVTVPANGRQTINIEALEPAAPELVNAAVGTRVSATAPVVVERAQYWPGPPQSWYEAHNSFGVTAPALRWGLAEGRVGNPAGFPPAAYQTYVLLANPGSTAATATLTLLRTNGTTFTKTFNVAAQSRRNVQIGGASSDLPELTDEVFGVVIDATQPIAVERAMYGSTSTQPFAAGTNATATPLP